MPRLSSFCAAAALSATMLGHAASAQSASTVEQARAARFANEPTKSAELLDDWLSAHPEDADAWLENGYAQTMLGDYPGARRSFGQVLTKSPGYVDAEIGLARLDFFEGRNDAALSRLARLEPTSETRALTGQVLEAHAAGQPAFVRADLFAERSTLTSALPDWTALAASLTGRLSDQTALNATIEHTRRFGREDLFVQVQADHAFSPRWDAYAGLGGTLDADFRPRTIIFAGSDVRLVSPGSVSPGLSATLTTSFAEYASGEVITLSPGLTARFRNNTARIGGRLIALRDETGDVRFGQAVDAGLALTSQLGLRAVWSDAPETSEGRTIDVEAASLFLQWPLTDRIEASLGAVSEERSAYDRTAISVSLSRSLN